MLCVVTPQGRSCVRKCKAGPTSVRKDEALEDSSLDPKSRCIPVLWAMHRFDRPLTESEIAAIYQMNIEDVRYHLRHLSNEGLVARLGRYKGWTLTSGGSQFLLPSQEQAQIPVQVIGPLAEHSSQDSLALERGKSALKIKNPPGIRPRDIPPTRKIRARSRKRL
jgi:hypothetical protein